MCKAGNVTARLLGYRGIYASILCLTDSGNIRGLSSDVLVVDMILKIPVFSTIQFGGDDIE